MNLNIKDELVIDLKRKHKAVRDARKRILNGDPEEKFTGKAFVILNNQKYVDVLINKFKRTRLKRILTHIAFQWLKLSKKKYQDDKWWQGKRVDMERATEPTNIYWENMAIQPNDRFWRTLATYGAACLCLLVVFFLNVGISVIQNNINEDLDKKDNKSFSYIFLTSLSFLSSILIAANNTILYHVIMYISKFERHQTHVKYYAAVSFKLTICMVINSGVIPLVVNPGKKNWFNPGGLAVDMFFIVFALSFISPTVCLFDPLHYWKRFRFWWEERKGEKSRMTQREANKLAGGIEWEVPYYYGLSMSKLIITFFYTPCIPILPFVSLLGTIYMYWVEKYLLLRINKFPREMGTFLALTFINVVPFTLFSFALGQFTFVITLSEGENNYPWIALGLTIFSIIINLSACP